MQRNVLEYLVQTAHRLPDGIAIADDQLEIRFSELLAGARRLGGRIRELAGSRHRPVAVLSRRLPEEVMGFLGALWAGCFYVPLDAAMPRDRLEGILRELSPAAILFPEKDRKTAEALADPALLLPLAAAEELPDPGDEPAPWRSLPDTNPCYMIYTSGSTGTPKGILISHRSVIDFTDWYAGLTGVTERDRLGNQAPFFFDLSGKDLYLTLKTGAETFILAKKCFSFPVLLIRSLDEQRITTLSWSTAAFHMVANSGVLEKYPPKTLKRVLLGGEALQARQLNIWRSALPDVHYVNLYGPTETTVDCTYYPIDRDFADGEDIPIGRPCENMEILILDEENRLCAPGEIGELCARGTGLAIGYFRDPEKTAAAFVQNPLNPDWPDRIYRTGDLGYWGEDGLIRFVGRKDSQIKHNGYRIELGEIETALNALAGVSGGVCLFDEASDRIVAFYTGSPELPELVKALKERLPKYMIPEEFRHLEGLPRLPNGKTDRSRLRRELQR